MKLKQLGLLTTLSLALCALAPAHAKNAEEKLTLRLGFEVSLDSAQGVGGTEMARVAREKSKGNIDIQLFSDSKLGTGLQMIEMVKKGELDIFQGAAGMFSSMESRLDVFDIPFLFANFKQAYKVLDSQFGYEMLATLEPHGLKGMSFWDNGVSLVNDNARPISKSEDQAGLKMDDIPSNAVHVLWNGPLIQVMNLEKFKALPKTSQKILLEASLAGAVAQRKSAKVNGVKFIEDMEHKGVKANGVSDSAAFREKVRPAIEKQYVDKNGDQWLKKINASLATGKQE